VHNVTTSSFLPPSFKLTVIDWVSLKLSKSTQETRRTHGEPRRKTTSGLLPPRMILSVFDCSKFEQSEYGEQIRQDTVEIRLENTSKGFYSGINIIRDHSSRSDYVGPVVFDRIHVVDQNKWWCFRAVSGALVWVFYELPLFHVRLVNSKRFHHGDSRPEVVIRSSPWCAKRSEQTGQP